MNLRDLITNKLFPRKASISKHFEVHRKDVKVEATYSPLGDAAVGFNVHITDKEPFSMVTSTKDMLKMGVDTVQCAVFDLEVIHCGLTPKLPMCKSCPLNHE